MAECAFHKGVETGLSCVECGRYICPKDMVDTPVGYKCKECGRSRRPTLGGVKPRQYLLGAMSGIGAGAALGVILLFVPFMSFWLSILGGIGVAEATRRGAGGHRTWEFAVIAAVGAVLGVGVAAAFGSLISLKVILDLKNGRAAAVEKVRTRERGFEALKALAEPHQPPASRFHASLLPAITPHPAPLLGY